MAPQPTLPPAFDWDWYWEGILRCRRYQRLLELVEQETLDALPKAPQYKQYKFNQCLIGVIGDRLTLPIFGFSNFMSACLIPLHLFVILATPILAVTLFIAAFSFYRVYKKQQKDRENLIKDFQLAQLHLRAVNYFLGINEPDFAYTAVGNHTFCDTLDIVCEKSILVSGNIYGVLVLVPYYTLTVVGVIALVSFTGLCALGGIFAITSVMALVSAYKHACATNQDERLEDDLKELQALISERKEMLARPPGQQFFPRIVNERPVNGVFEPVTPAQLSANSR